jgi:methionyl-tRNA formyltransferase
VLEAALAEGGGVPGTVFDEGLTIACAGGAIRLLKVQRAGRGAMTTGELLRGFAIPQGATLE